ncbi:MAG: Rieske (2Fe-2S) protein [Myxococcota bacterium]|nr:Rieske (2Fe-2S) protein [Myxococcota bacterium]
MSDAKDPAGSPKRPKRVALYERVVRAPLSRVWENVYDWEHLPWLHRESFASIALEESGRWGWRARVGLPPAESGASMRIELLVDRDEQRYVTRTVEGPGAGTEIWTRLAEVSSAETAVTVEFHVPGLDEPASEALGAALVKLYTRLWDQDESMIQERERRTAHSLPKRSEEYSPGSRVALLAELPTTVKFDGVRIRLEERGGSVRAYSLVCPHWLGPLDVDPEAPDTLVCPWHGYRFDVQTGQSCDGHALRLGPAPAVEVQGAEIFLRRGGAVEAV